MSLILPYVIAWVIVHHWALHHCVCTFWATCIIYMQPRGIPYNLAQIMRDMQSHNILSSSFVFPPNILLVICTCIYWIGLLLAVSPSGPIIEFSEVGLQILIHKQLHAWHVFNYMTACVHVTQGHSHQFCYCVLVRLTIEIQKYALQRAECSSHAHFRQ